MTEPVAIEGCYVATVDPAGSEYPSGHVVMDRGRIVAAGPGPVPPEYARATRVDGSGRLVTPGLVNTHSHLYQWVLTSPGVTSRPEPSTRAARANSGGTGPGRPPRSGPGP